MTIKKGKGMGKARLILLATATLLAMSAVASADWDGVSTIGTFSPSFSAISALTPDTQTSLGLEIGERYTDKLITKYSVHIPAGYRISIGSVRESTYSNCVPFETNTKATLDGNAENIGPASLTLGINGSSPKYAPVKYTAFVYFLRYVPSSSTTGTATLCVVAATASTLINAANRTIVYQVNLTLNADRSWDALWNLNAVPGATDTNHSIVDSPYYQAQKVQVFDLSFSFLSFTQGNYNIDPSTGKKYKVPFVFTPVSTGDYDFLAHLYPCGTQAGDPAGCASTFSPATVTRTVSIAPLSEGIHNMPILTAPARFSGIGTQAYALPIKGKTTVDFTWAPPSVGVNEAIKGYVLATGVPYQQNLIHFDYLISNPSLQPDPAKNPCGADGKATSCKFTLQFPVVTTSGQSLGANGLYDTSIVAVYVDGHRSDGRCDDGVGPGTAAPCSDGKIPRFTEPGYTHLIYMIESRDWPLVYYQVDTHQEGPSGKPDRVRVDQVSLLFVDYDAGQAEFVLERPYGATYFMQATTIVGDNITGTGIVNFLDNTNTQGKRFSMQLETDPLFGANGFYEIWQSTIQLNTDVYPVSLGMSQM